MRRLELFNSHLRPLELLRSNLERGRRFTLLVGPDRALNRQFFFGLIEGTLGLGHVVGSLTPDDPEFPPEDPLLKAIFFQRLTPQGGFNQELYLRSALRQDPDSILLSEFEDSAFRIFFQAILTGHAAGSLVACTADNLEQAIARMTAKVTEAAILESALNQCLLVELSPRFKHHAIRRIAVFDPSQEPARLIDLARQRELNFDPDRDPERAREFFSKLYDYNDLLKDLENELQPKVTVAKTVDEPLIAEEPAPVELTDPLTAEPLNSQLGKDALGWLRRRRRTALIPVWKADNPELLNSVGAAAKTSSAWPEFTADKGVMVLQLKTDALPESLSFLPENHWLQLFFTSRTEDLDFSTPFHTDFKARLIPADQNDLPASAQVSLLRESFEIVDFKIAPFDYPDYADCEPGWKAHPPNVRATKIGGWPSWAQSAEWPSCPHCQSRMEFVFQFGNRALADALVGPDFTDFLFVCRSHLDTWAMVHQCT